MNVLRKLKRLRPAALLGIDGQSQILNDRFREVTAALDNQSRLLNDKLGQLIEAVNGQRQSAAFRADNLASALDAVCALATTPKLAAVAFDRVLRDVVRRYHHSVSWGDRLLTLDKSAAFRDEPAFVAALEKADSGTGANLYESPDGISWRYNTLIWAARVCLELPGDFVECGVFRGDMSWMITQSVDLRGSGKKFFLYDTFTGFDSRYSTAEDFPESPGLFAFLQSQYGDPDIEHHVRRRFCDAPYVIVVKGVVPDILHRISPDRIAFMHLDMNSARAELGALEVLFDRVVVGGIIIFDDYGWKEHHRQKEAADAFMGARGLAILELPTGQGMAIRR
jgi:O-methyltransferase